MKPGALDQTLGELTRRIQELEAELASAAPRRRAARRAWIGAPLLAVAILALGAQAPATPDPDIERRLGALENLVRRGPGNATQMTAPFEVVSADGTPIVRVGGIPDSKVPISIGTIPRGGGVISVADGGVAQAVMSASSGRGELAALDAQGVTRAALLGTGGLVVYDPAGQQLAGVTQGDAGGGRIGIWRAGKRLVDITTDAGSSGSGLVSINAPSGQSVARLSAGDGAGELVLANAAGTRLAFLGAKGGSGAATVMNSAGKAVAGLIGSGAGGGAVAVGTTNGATVAEMSVADDGRGLFQVRARGGGRTLAVLTQAPDAVGGIVQISNGSTEVASLTVGSQGAGYLQLANASGTPTVEAGTLPNGKGQVRAGPLYKCLPVQAATPVLSVGLPDCILGGTK